MNFLKENLLALRSFNERNPIKKPLSTKKRETQWPPVEINFNSLVKTTGSCRYCIPSLTQCPKRTREAAKNLNTSKF